MEERKKCGGSLTFFGDCERKALYKKAFHLFASLKENYS